MNMTRNRQRSHPRISAAIGVLLLLAATSACADDKTEASGGAREDAVSSVKVRDVWARPSIAGGNTAVYLSIDGGLTDDALLGVITDPGFAEKVEIHETVLVDSDADTDGGHESEDAVDVPNDSGTSEPDQGGQDTPESGRKMRTMRPVESIEVLADTTVELRPGGYHVMVMNLGAELSVGDSFPVTLKFEKAGDVDATAEVREA